MATTTQKYGPWAVITGASSGIGEEFAKQLAVQGMHLVLVARRGDACTALGESLKAAHQIEFRVLALDLIDPASTAALAEGTQDLDVGLLVNNAGFGSSGHFLDTDPEGQLRMVDLNCRAVVAVTQVFAPRMKAAGRGGIIITASMVSFSSSPGWTVYAATKAFDRFFAEGLAAELAPHGVDVLALCPGGTHTGFVDAAGMSVTSLASKFMMPVQPVVRTGLRSLGRRHTVVPGLLNALQSWWLRRMPLRLSTWIMGRVVALMA